MTIIRHIDGRILFRAETDDMAECLRQATRLNVDIQGAALYRLDLKDTNLKEINLSRAYIHNTNFHGSNISDVNLRGANLIETNFSSATLYSVDFREAYLMGANFTNAEMNYTNLQDADIREAIGIDPYVISSLSILPEGDVIGWKKCQNGVLVKLKIPAEAQRSNSTSRKCRAEYATVLEVINGPTGISLWDGSVIYERRKIITCDHWNEDPWVTCGGGIHFFITRKEAEAFEL